MSTQLTQPIPNMAGALVPVSEDHPPQEVERERSERRRNYPRLTKYLVKTCESLESLDKSERVRVREAQVRCQAYYDGRQDGEVRNGVWTDNPSISGEIIPKDNQYKIQIDKLLMEMCRADTKFTVEAADESSQEMREAAQFYEHRLEVNRERIENEPFTQGENMALLLKTIAFRYTYFDAKDKTEGTELAPVMQRIPVEGRGVTVCRTCGRPRSPDTVASSLVDKPEVPPGTACPHCGDTGTRQIGVSAGEGVQIDYEEVPAGRVVTVRPDSTMVQLDLNARDIPSSRFLRWRLVLRRCEWEAMFPGRKIPSPTKSDDANYRDDFQGHASNDDGWGVSSEDEISVTGGEQWEKIEGDLVWLDPVVYGDYLNKEDEKLPGGRVLPADMPLREMYSEGACVIKIGSDIFDIYPSNKNECWSMAVYGIREHALHGAGTLSLLGPQDTINDENAYIVANHYQNAARREFVKDGVFTGNKLPNVNQLGIVNSGFEGQIVGEAYAASSPSSLAPDVYQFRESQRGAMQEHAGTSSLSMQGAADRKVLGTATGVEAARDQAVGRMIPNMLLKMAMQREWCYQVGVLERENYTPDRFLKLAGKGTEKGEVKFTARGVKSFFKSDIRRDFVVRPVSGSWMPTAPHQKKANASDFAMVASKIQSPELLSLLAPEFGIEYAANEWGAAERVASMRLAEYARVCKVIESAGYPADDAMAGVVLSQVPEWATPDDEMDKHPAFRDYYEDWWASDEGVAASPLLRLVVRKVHALHQSGMVAQQQTENAGAAASQIPVKAAEVVSNAVDAEQQAGLQEDQAAQGMRQQQADRELQAVTQAAATGAIPVEEAVAVKDRIMSGEPGL